MKNYQSPRFLFLALGVEVLIGVFFLIFSGGIDTIVTILLLALFLGGSIFVLNRNGMVSPDWFGSHQSNSKEEGWNKMQWSNNEPAGQPMPGGNAGFNLNMGLNINPGFERTETFSQEYSLASGVTALQVEVNNGNLKVTGEVGATQVRLNAIKRVWEKDEAAIRRELDRLEVRTRQEGNLFIIEAGQFDTNANSFNLGVNINLGKPPRIDLELIVPPALAASLSTNTGTLELSEFEGEVAARTVAGTMQIQNVRGGRNLTVGTNSGRIVMQQITAGILRVRATTGSLDLTAIGAEAVELETLAGAVRMRGVNCGRLQATASTGSIELADVNADGPLQLKATAGRIQTDNIRASSLNLETTTGTVRYRGTAPTAPSQVLTGVGSTDLIFSPGANFQLEARSNVGSVQVLLPVSTTYTANRNWFRGQIGTGGPLLNVSSQVGSVRISQG